MRHVIGPVMGLTLAALPLLAGAAFSAGVMGLGDQFNQTFDNQSLRVMETTIKPGESVEKRIQAGHLIYLLTPGQLEVRALNGETQRIQGDAGESHWMQSGVQGFRNTGDTEVRALVVEPKAGKTNRR